MKRALTRCRTPLALLGALAFTFTAQAQPDDRYDGPQADDIRQTVVRVAYVSGEVSYSRGDDPDNWQPASLNFPMTLGDRLYTTSGARLELQTEGGAIYMAPGSDLAALNVTYDVKQFSLGIGSASFQIRRIGSGESYEVDTPNAAVTFDRPGDYRVDVSRGGDTRVYVSRGFAYVAAAGGEVPLQEGRLMVIDGIDSPVYDVASLPRPDAWDRWVRSRSRRFRDTDRYVSVDIAGVDDLDQYGSWSEVSGYGTCWTPRNVSADWQPYRAGRWVWQDPWGWSWVSNEPWGWAPYHYGRWVTARSRWYWVPVGPNVRTVRYAPALVAFVGGPGFSLSFSVGGGGGGGGYVGWFPLAPRDPFVPWWGSHARATNVTHATNVTYVNRTSVTIVNQNTFVSGAPVGRNLIRDARAVREISAAPVVRGPISVVPLASSIRVSTERTGPAQRPPAAALNRAVVTRRAPPPAPAPFREKEKVIRENRGAPVAPAEDVRLPGRTRATLPTRPVFVEGGQVKLAPKDARGGVPAPVPVTREARPEQPSRQQEVEQQQRGQDARKAQEEQQQRGQDARKAQEEQQQRGQDARKAQEQQQQRVQDARKAQEEQQQRVQDARKAQEEQQQRGQDARKAQEQQQQRVQDARKAQEPSAREKQAAEKKKKLEKEKGKDRTPPPDERKD